MNERIKQLAEQAGFKVNWQHPDVQAIKMARFEKFAELIYNDIITVVAEGGLPTANLRDVGSGAAYSDVVSDGGMDPR